MKSVDDVMVGAITAGGNDEVRLFLTRSSCKLHEVRGALAFPDIEVNVLLAKGFERTFEEATRFASLRGGVEQDDDSHRCAWEGCRIEIRKSRRSVVRREVMRHF